MSDRFAFVFIGLIFALFFADLLLNGGTTVVFLGRKLMNLIEWLAFWR